MLDIKNADELERWFDALPFDVGSQFLLALAMSSLVHVNPINQPADARLSLFRLIVEIKRLNWVGEHFGAIAKLNQNLEQNAVKFVSNGWHQGASTGIRLLTYTVRRIYVTNNREGFIKYICDQRNSLFLIFAGWGPKGYQPKTPEEISAYQMRVKQSESANWRSVSELANSFSERLERGEATFPLIFRGVSGFRLTDESINLAGSHRSERSDPFQIVVEQADRSSGSLFGFTPKDEHVILDYLTKTEGGTSNSESDIKTISRLFESAVSDRSLIENNGNSDLPAEKLMEQMSSLSGYLSDIRSIMEKHPPLITNSTHNYQANSLSDDAELYSPDNIIRVVDRIENERKNFVSGGVADPNELTSCLDVLGRYLRVISVGGLIAIGSGAASAFGGILFEEFLKQNPTLASALHGVVLIVSNWISYIYSTIC